MNSAHQSVTGQTTLSSEIETEADAAIAAAADAPAPVRRDASDEFAIFLSQLGELFGCQTFTQVEWNTSGGAFVWNHALEDQALATRQLAAEVPAERLPLADDAAEAVFTFGTLANLHDLEVVDATTELYRVTKDSLWVSIATTPGRERGWWEARFFAAGFRKHPRLMEAFPYESLEHDGAAITLVLQKIPLAGLRLYPLSVMAKERDLHRDMFRDSGRRSDGHVSRYVLARQFLPDEGLVLDAACGLGYGSAVLACTHPRVRVCGIDNSEFAVAYSRACYQPTYGNVEFKVGDACDLSAYADDSVSLVVSFETVEHLAEPERFLAEVKRVLKRGGRFICSIPNEWLDEHGKDPNPHHLHVFNFEKVAALCGRFLTVEHAYLQVAGGGMKHTSSPRQLREVKMPVIESDHQAEWWLVVGAKN